MPLGNHLAPGRVTPETSMLLRIASKAFFEIPAPIPRDCGGAAKSLGGRQADCTACALAFASRGFGPTEREDYDGWVVSILTSRKVRRPGRQDLRKLPAAVHRLLLSWFEHHH